MAQVAMKPGESLKLSANRRRSSQSSPARRLKEADDGPSTLSSLGFPIKLRKEPSHNTGARILDMSGLFKYSMLLLHSLPADLPPLDDRLVTTLESLLDDSSEEETEECIAKLSMSSLSDMERIRQRLKSFIAILLGNHYIVHDCGSPSEDSPEPDMLIIKQPNFKHSSVPRVGVDANIMVKVMSKNDFVARPYDLKLCLKQMFGERIGFTYGYAIIVSPSNFVCVELDWTGEIAVSPLCSMDTLDHLIYLKCFIQDADPSPFELPQLRAINAKDATKLERRAFKTVGLIACKPGSMMYGVEDGHILKVESRAKPGKKHSTSLQEMELFNLNVLGPHPNIVRLIAYDAPCLVLSPRENTIWGPW